MLEKPEASSALGIELEGSILKAVKLTAFKNKPKLDQFFEINLNPEHVNLLYTSEEGKNLEKHLNNSLTISALNTNEVLIRQLEIKLKKNKDIEEVLLFQTEPLLPYPTENAILDYVKVGSTEDGTLLTVLAARKDHLQQHLERLSKLQMEPEVITSTPAALACFASVFAPSEQSYCILHLGLEETSCVLIHNNKLLAAQAIQHSIIHLKQALGNEAETSNLGDIDISQLSAENKPALYQAWDTLRLEIKRALFSLSKQSKGQPIKEILITGMGALIPHLASMLSKDLEMQQIFPRQELLPDLTMGQIQNLAVPIGAALNGLPITKDKINFRQGDVAYPKPWKRLTNSIALYAGLSLLLALAFYLFGQSYLSYREDQIRQSYIGLLTAMNQPYEIFEKEFESKIGSGNFKDLMMLSDADLLQRVQFLEKNLQETPDIFPLLPNVPKVSDILAWLSTQHLLIGKKNPGDITQTQPLQIESLNYSLVKRPDKNKKQEKYQVKLEIEFTSPTPKQAREFHDALIAPNDFVDPKGEVKWNSSHGRYRTSFYLKDKTIYPS